jgi:hypothetical protein
MEEARQQQGLASQKLQQMEQHCVGLSGEVASLRAQLQVRMGDHVAMWCGGGPHSRSTCISVFANCVLPARTAGLMTKQPSTG